MKIIKTAAIFLICITSLIGCSAKENHKNTAGLDNNTTTEDTNIKDNMKNGIRDAGNTVGNVTEDIGDGVEDITEGAGNAVKDITNQ